MELSNRMPEPQAAKALVGVRSRDNQPEPVKTEVRNIVVAHMKRNDPVTERFLHYIAMQSVRLLLFVRDGKKGRIITTPSADQLWTCREKAGSRTKVLFGVYRNFFDVRDKTRRWRLGFDDYYEVCIWEVLPNRSSGNFHQKILQVSFHAARLRWLDKNLLILIVTLRANLAILSTVIDWSMPRTCLGAMEKYSTSGYVSSYVRSASMVEQHVSARAFETVWDPALRKTLKVV